MKIIFSLFAIMLFSKDCDSEKKISSSDMTTTPVEKMTLANQEDVSISYQASSRGIFEKTWITKDSITYTDDRSMTNKKSMPLSEKDWNEMMQLYKKIDMTSLADLKAPTEKRLHDGAAIANLSITQNSQTTESNSFDHGFPPKDIEALVNKVLSLKEMVLKQ